MLNPFQIILSALAIFLCHPSAALAQAGEETAAVLSPYEQIYAALMKAQDREVMFDNAIEASEQALLDQDPNIAKLEAARPGVVHAYGEAIRPFMVQHSDRVSEMFKPLVLQMLTEELTPDDASRMAAFYHSPVGQKLISGVSENYSPTNMLTGADFESGKIRSEDAVRDIQAAAVKGASEMTDADAMSKDTAPLRDPKLMAKMEKVNKRLVVLRVQMEQEPPTPEMRAAMTDAIQRAVRQHLEGPAE